jgi:hypothetical protein
LTGNEELTGEVDLDFQKPEGFDKYLNKMNIDMRFEQPHLISSFDKQYLGLKMVNADRLRVRLRLINVNLNYLP